MCDNGDSVLIIHSINLQHNISWAGMSGDNCTLSLVERIRLSKELEFQLNSTKIYASIMHSIETTVGLSVAWAIIGLIGLVANALVLWWIRSRKKKRSRVDAYIVSLSVIDLLTIVIRTPKSILLLLSGRNWASLSDSLGTVVCRATAYMESAFQCMSFILLCIIAVDRYIAICHPIFHYKKASRKYVNVIVAISLACIISLSIPIRDVVTSRLSYTIDMIGQDTEFGFVDKRDFFMEFRCVPDETHYVETGELICAADPERCKDVQLHRRCLIKDQHLTLVMFILFYPIPCLLMIFCYANIIHRLWIRKAIDVATNQRYHENIQRNTRTNTVMIIILWIVFGVLWLPLWICNLLDIYMVKTENHTNLPDSNLNNSLMVNRERDLIRSLCSITAMLSVISSPIIYLMRDKNFQKLIKNHFERMSRMEYHSNLSYIGS